MSAPISVVMCSRDDARFAAATAVWARAMGWADYEIVRIPDARSMCEGYNRGVALAKHERLIFCHDDIEFLCDDLPGRLDAHFARFDLFGAAGTTKLIGPAYSYAGPPYVVGQVAHELPSRPLQLDVFAAPAASVGNVQALDGTLMAVRRNVLDRVRWDERYDHFHLYDIDFSFAAHRAGFAVGVACDLGLLHRSLGAFGTPEWNRAANLFMEKWLPALPPVPERLRRWTQAQIFPLDRADCAAAMREQLDRPPSAPPA